MEKKTSYVSTFDNMDFDIEKLEINRRGKSKIVSPEASFPRKSSLESLKSRARGHLDAFKMCTDVLFFYIIAWIIKNIMHYRNTLQKYLLSLHCNFIKITHCSFWKYSL